MSIVRAYIKPLIVLFILGIGLNSCKKPQLDGVDRFIAVKDYDKDVYLRSCFQLRDGSFIMCGNISEKRNSIVSRFSKDGNHIWTKTLDGKMNEIARGLPLPDGNFILAGYDSLTFNGNITIQKFTSEGDIIKQSSVLNHPAPSLENPNLDITALKNGDIACIANSWRMGNPSSKYLKLFVFNAELSLINSKNYDDSVKLRSISAPAIHENNKGDLAISCSYSYYEDYSAFILTVDRDTLNIKEIHDVKLGTNQAAGRPGIDRNGNFIYGYGYNTNTNYIFFRSREMFSPGNDIMASRVSEAGKVLETGKLAHLTNLGCVFSIKSTTDGGFIIAGLNDQSPATSQSGSYLPYSNTTVLLIKTNSNLKTEWTKTFKTSYLSAGFDVVQTTDGGYAIGCITKSFDNLYKMMLIKTDKNGN